MQVHQRSLESFEDNNSNPFFVSRDKMYTFLPNILTRLYRNSYSNSSKNILWIVTRNVATYIN